MKFPHRPSPPPYLNRRDQYRMLGLCLLLLLVLFAIDVARKPKNWEWFFRMGGPSSVRDENDLRDIDFRVIEPGHDGVAPDEIVVLPEEQAASRGAAEEPFMPADLRQLDARMLAGVQDQRVGFLRAEHPALQALITHVRQAPFQELQRSGDAQVGFRVINVEPERYRGRLITIQGVLRRYEPFELPALSTEEGMLLHQGWIFTSDSANNPWFALCTERTPDLPLSSQTEIPVRFTGYFFKRYGYATTTGLHVAPLLIGKRFELLPTPAADSGRTRDLTRAVVAVMAVIGGLFALMIWRFAVSDRRFARSRLAQIAASRLDARPEDLAALHQWQATDPNRLQLPPDDQAESGTSG